MQINKSITSLFVIILTCAILGSLVVQPVQAPVIRYYAGYFFNRYTYNTHVPGVYGQIICIDPYIPTQETNMISQWVTIITSYVPEVNWVQVGYRKGGIPYGGYYNGLRYFAEYYSTGTNPYYVNIVSGSGSQKDMKIFRNTTGEYWQYLTTSSGQPTSGQWHNYAVRHPYELSWEIPPSTDRTEFRTFKDNMGASWVTYKGISPYNIIDAQAFSETTVVSIYMTGTHFRELHIYDTTLYYYYWNHHVPKNDWPYTLTQTSDKEFYANGGA